jgi:mannose-6-phosphate isomerase-like protein (cupin superfamily)
MSVLTPSLVTAESAPVVNFLGRPVTTLAGSDQTGGAYTLCRYQLDKGYGPPRHVHHAEDELFYLLSGTMLAFCGDQRLTVEPGGAAFLPRGLPHAFIITDGPADLIQISNPAGFETFMAEVGPTTDPAHIAEVASRHNIEILGPPLDLSTVGQENP